MLLPKYLLQHHTSSSYEGTIEVFTTGNVSAHFVIAKDGIVEEFVDPKFRAYHAGAGDLRVGSKLNRKIPEEVIEDDMNSWSIGIENVNTGNEEFPLQQIISNTILCQNLCREFHMDPKLMLGHSDWAPARKIDPSVFFPWELFANASEKFSNHGVEKNFGVYPRKNDLDLTSTPDVVLSYDKYCKKEITKEQIAEIQTCLRDYGYDIPDSEMGKVGIKTQAAVLAYKIHFVGPEIISDPMQKQAWDDLWEDSSNHGTRVLLSHFNENDLKCLGDVLDQFSE